MRGKFENGTGEFLGHDIEGRPDLRALSCVRSGTLPIPLAAIPSTSHEESARHIGER